VPKRVCIVQPIVPRYRVPLFEALAREPGLDLEVWANLRGSLGSIRGVQHSDVFRLRHAWYAEWGGVVLQPMAMRAVRSGFDGVVLSENVRSPAMFGALLRRRCPVVLWGHGIGKNHERLGRQLRLRSFGMADAGLLYGPTAKAQLELSGIDPAKLFVAPNAVDQVPVEAARRAWLQPGRLRQFRDRHDLQDRPVLLYLARLEPDKLPLMAIDALVRVRSELPGAVLAIIGEGSQREAIAEHAVRCGVSDAVRLVGALFEESEIAPWALSASLLVHPGGIGLSMLHAFGFGLPVVTSDNPRIHGPEFECLRPESNGLTYRHGDVDDLARACTRIMSSAQLRERLSRGALDAVKGPQGRTIPSMVRGFMEALGCASSRWRRRQPA
jgi:glycosyltransferase involved in cell wall biosynthesis